MNWFKRLFKKKVSLKDKVIEMYGSEAGELYDNINRGIPIGGFVETACFLQMVEDVRKELN